MSLFNKLFNSRVETSKKFDYKGLSKQFLNCISEFTSQYGFVRRGQSYSFERKIDNRIEILQFPIAKHDTYLDVLPSVAVRFDELEKFINKYAVNRDVKLSKHKASISATFGELSGAGNQILRWKIKNSHDIAKAIPAIEKKFAQTGECYFQRFQSLDELFSSVCVKNEPGHIHGNSERAIYCVALAHLVGYGDFSCEKIIRQWLEYFEQNKDPSYQFFDGFLRNFTAD